MTAPPRQRFGGRVETPPDASGVARSADGTRIAWRAYGDGQPVLLVMGFMGSGHAWYRLIPHVATARRAIVLDNRGTGESDQGLGVWSMRDLAGDARAVLDAAGVERAHVIGTSMGGMIVQHLALDHPERVRSLTLCATTARGGGRRGPPPWRILASLGLRPVIGTTRTIRLVAPLLYSERTRGDPERLADELALRANDATPLPTAPAQFAAIVRHDTRSRLAELAGTPVLIVHGSEDRLVPPDAGRELAGLIPGAGLAILPGCGHVFLSDCEEEAASAIIDFLDGVEEGV